MKTATIFAACAAFAWFAPASLQSQTVTGSGRSNTVPIWTSTSKLGSSILKQSGTTLSVDGKLQVFSSSGDAVDGLSSSGVGLNGFSTSGFGLYGAATDGIGVFGGSTSSVGVEGSSKSGVGVSGTSNAEQGVMGSSDSYFGVEGSSKTNAGVYGTSESYIGVWGIAQKKGGVVGESTDGDGMGGIACASCSGPAAVVGEGKLAGSFGGNVIVTNNLAVSGLKQFHIDHPLDPANKYLNHFSMESNEVLNSYSGNVTTDGSGAATVELPDYFEALNKDYRYQLTVIGQFAQAIVAEEIHGNRFAIKTDKPSVKVSWQVTGVRSDAYAKAHPVPVEEAKPEQERGYYLTPDVFGQPEEKSLNWLYHPDLMREARAMEERRQAEAAADLMQKQGLETSGNN